jgi:hypothetical protein
VPQCYGCHVKVDYSREKDGKQKSGIDWVASGHAQKKNGQTAESVLGSGGIKQSMDIVEDLIDARTGEIIPQKYSVQIPGIPKLKFDWSKIVERDGTQVATVGTHWPMSQAFNKAELATPCCGPAPAWAVTRTWPTRKSGRRSVKKASLILSSTSR